MHGIGDQIYQRPFVKNLVKQGHKVYIKTFLPEIYKDINVKFVQPNPEGTYRTQQKAFSQIKWATLPSEYKTIKPFYTGADLINTSIIHAMKVKFQEFGDMTELDWSLPWYNKETIRVPKGKKLALIRPATVRNEWKVLTRNPDPEYINWCAKVLLESGYYVVSIADCDGINEYIVGDDPPADLHLHKGELGIFGTLNLIQEANIVVGGSGFIIPATVSSEKTNLFTIFGGRMAYDSPYKVFHTSMDMKRIGWAMPNNPCRCTLTKHDCNKKINNLDDKFMEFLGRIQ